MLLKIGDGIPSEQRRGFAVFLEQDHVYEEARQSERPAS
jgi:hypothetical protein